MAINGIDTLVYAVANVAESRRFFEDFGLVRDPAAADGDEVATFLLPEGSRVVVRHRDDPALPPTEMVGDGVREVIWGTDTPAARDALVRELATDRRVEIDDRGVARFVADFGVPMGLRHFERRAVVTAPDPLNSPGRINRLNQHRKWRRRARPKVISHVVFAVPDYEGGARFMRERLGFRLSDSQRGFGKYLRADGTLAHHSLLLLNARAPVPDMDGRLRFHHANFGVEDIDEIMVGANHMMRSGWPASHFGLGRHRIDSALFYYIPCPAGGEAEYGADGDAVDDSWVPRDWINPLFGYAHFVSNLPPFLADEPSWDFRYITEGDAPLDADLPQGGH
jgi:catechol 2,3-dioxygenase-like lactoylglutathione lyase family enzyme